MIPASNSAPPILNPAVSPERTLHRLFLTLFLRGRSSRGLRKSSAPKSVGSKLALTVVLYALVGLVALTFQRQPIFVLALYLHAMTLVFLGMFVAASAGEILFNKEEADILLHRPIAPRTLLWAKIGVLVQVSLWLAGAFNLAGFFIGVRSPDGGWLFPLAHVISTAFEALFCTGFVVVTYQLCLRWFGREKLEGLMTTVQVIVALAAVLGGQLVPQLIARFGGNLRLGLDSWWIALLPPAWFAGFDDALAGSRAPTSWMLGGAALFLTIVVLWLAFGRLAKDYESGLQSLGESVSRPKKAGGRRWVAAMVQAPPLKWWLRDSVSRAAFLLTAAYLFRDRDVKLRVYPGLAPVLVMPLIFLLQSRRGGVHDGGFSVAFSGAYLGLIPLLGLSLLQYSQQWQATDLFRAAPMVGPIALCHGARRAVLCILTLPMLSLFALVAWLVPGDATRLLLLLPGIIALPVFSLIPSMGGKCVPFSLPTEEAKSAGRGLTMIGVMIASFALAGLTAWSWSGGWFWWLVLVETIVGVIIYAMIRASLASVRWPPME
ncbi:MAG: hypothetical protein ABIQ35_01050 [Verrucomicrobiota bacterium]